MGVIKIWAFTRQGGSDSVFALHGMNGRDWKNVRLASIHIIG